MIFPQEDVTHLFFFFFVRVFYDVHKLKQEKAMFYVLLLIFFSLFIMDFRFFWMVKSFFFFSNKKGMEKLKG